MTTAQLKLVDPFKVRKHSNTKEKDAPVHPPLEIAISVDIFVDAKREVKRLEGECADHKKPILEFARLEFAKRALKGKDESSFNIAGEEELVLFVHENRGSSLNDEDVQALVDEVGEERAAEMLQIDLHSFKFNVAALEQHFDEVVKVLQQLPKEILEQLITPGAVVMRSGAYDKAKEVAESPEQLAKIAEILKIRSYLK